MSLTHRARRLLLATAAAAVLGVAAIGLAQPALASCATKPADSPYAFTGDVTRTEDDDRVAHVTTEDGHEVIVRGSPFSDNEYSATRAIGRTSQATPPEDRADASRSGSSPASDLGWPWLAGGPVALLLMLTFGPWASGRQAAAT